MQNHFPLFLLSYTGWSRVCIKHAAGKVNTNSRWFEPREIQPQLEAFSVNKIIRCPDRELDSHQNLNSGNLLMKGRNSSFCLVGRDGPSSAGGRVYRMKWLLIR
uniref:Uncharacterized protein n=1 Tax=Mastacembelus armatus TaxID=205130 RepID=A0A7N8XWJ6_9TELE